ncbi:MAG: beta-lactamase family protein [Lachnospiraceae bacterium]|nr:beta-lactamase family protein [Lachnospiraceae bacterium]
MKRFVAGFLACVVVMTVVVVPVISVQAAGYHEYDMEDYVVQEMDAANIMGISMSVVSDEKEIYSAAFGADAQTGDDYILGSLVQSMTALSVLRMVEDGEIQLNDMLSEYLPEYSTLQNVTIEELLTQTSGIPMSAMSADGRDLWVQNGSGKYEESYANYNLLGKVIEVVSGETYEEYLTENILDPCKMSSTYSLRQNPELSGQVKPVYQTMLGYPNKTRFHYREGQWADVSSGYLLSDVKDMGSYLQMYLKNDGEILQQASIHQVLQESQKIQEATPTNQLFGTEEAYTMGWISTKVEGTQSYYQMSCLANTMTYMLLVPEKNAGIIMMFNAADYMVGRKLTRSICAGVTQILLDQEPGHIKQGTYFKQHGTIDLILLLLLIAVWMPILLIGVWGKRVGVKFSILRLMKDVILHIVLPTVLLILLPQLFGPWRVWQEYTPDLVYVVWILIATLYLGAVVKLLQFVIVMIRRKLHAADEDEIHDPILPMVKSDTGVVGGFIVIDPLDDELTDDDEAEEEIEMEIEEEIESEEEDFRD